MEFKFSDLINGIENLPVELLTYNSILYRIHNLSNGKNYIGTAKNGLPNRLYDRSYGHVNHYKWNTEYKCQGMYSDMNNNISDFIIIIEKELSSKEYEDILNLETEYIIRYDSVLNGYNVSIDGKPGWKVGTTCVNNGKYDLYIYQSDVDRFIASGRFSLGSCKHSNLKGTMFITNGIEDRMIYKSDFEEFSSLGYKKGRCYSPNKNKVWRNNGVKSRLIRIEDLNKDEFKGYIYEGRIEPPRKPRGKYSSGPKKTVNNGKDMKQIPVSELDEFLKNNPEFSLGRLKFNIVSNDELGITTHVYDHELGEYLSNGYRLGRLKRKKG